ncbi:MULTISPECIES: hypothetical protein [Hymenobacter]|uniref:Uncharacterized protein n=2 Tax=Hymenobacter TaxID=89966 RepID=A0ABS6WVL9_9BACT|nr:MULTISPECIES: hypothetical protein [Hymenobacter]MBO3271520.1 hypothetical protein [Hymenobacter defluvii]MBW3127660.1 hypothetical protein [Hymenobacter profundi]QNE38243.1 hypothetical protein F1C16_01075 [Hymenobacter sp. NBH84]
MANLPSAHSGDILLTHTIQALLQGPTGIPISTSLTHVDQWYQLLIDSGIPAFQDIARELGNLQSLISAEQDIFDGKSIGRSLSMLGAQTIQAADNVDDTLKADLSKLGDLLIKFGGDLENHALLA